MTNPKDLVGAKKAPMDLVPVAGAIMAAPAHQNGADKYGAFNWRLQPVQLMTYIGATKRHLDAFIDGQDLAEDTGLHHISHMIANLNIIADALGLGNLIDNRPPKGPAADMLRAQDKTIEGTLGTSIENAWARAVRALRYTPPGVLITQPVVYGMSREAWDSYGKLEQDCHCPPDWKEHGIECPFFHVARR